jgi:hypothetical protein
MPATLSFTSLVGTRKDDALALASPIPKSKSSFGSNKEVPYSIPSLVQCVVGVHLNNIRSCVHGPSTRARPSAAGGGGGAATRRAPTVVTRATADGPQQQKRQHKDDVASASASVALPRRAALALAAVGLPTAATPTGPARAIGFTKELKKKEPTDDEFAASTPFDFRG